MAKYYKEENGKMTEIEKPKDYSVYKVLAIVFFLAFLTLGYAAGH